MEVDLFLEECHLEITIFSFWLWAFESEEKHDILK